MIASDVIYPAGDVDDYRDGVYRPYRSAGRPLPVAAPLLGLPGNHDWYDGLAGFMYHFADRDRLPAAAYTPPAEHARAGAGPAVPDPVAAGRSAAAGHDRRCTTSDQPAGPESADPDAGPAGAVLRDPHQAPAAGRHRHRHRRPASIASSGTG